MILAQWIKGEQILWIALPIGVIGRSHISFAVWCINSKPDCNCLNWQAGRVLKSESISAQEGDFIWFHQYQLNIILNLFVYTNFPEALIFLNRRYFQGTWMSEFATSDYCTILDYGTPRSNVVIIYMHMSPLHMLWKKMLVFKRPYLVGRCPITKHPTNYLTIFLKFKIYVAW